MTEILRVRARWSGFTGGPGYSVLHFRDFGLGDGSSAGVDSDLALSAVTKTKAFFTSIAAYLPQTVKIDVEGDVDVIEDSNGELVNSLSVTAPAQQVGAGVGNYSGVSGAVVNWRTGGIRNGRKIRGRTFLVPFAVSAYGADGQLSVAARNGLVTSATALAASGEGAALGVYARPTASGSTDGRWAVVTGLNVPQKVAMLSSRRD